MKRVSAKTWLNNYLVQKKEGMIHYSTIKQGLEHAPEFICEVEYDGYKFQSGKCGNKIVAEEYVA